MAGPLRATWFFEQGKYGWSETLWAVTDDTYSGVLRSARALGVKRLAMLGTTSTMTFIRVSDDSVRRDSFLVELDQTTKDLGTLFGVSPSPSIQPFANILLRMEGSALYRRMAFLGGVPFDEITDPFQVSKIDGGWLKLFNSWRTAVAGLNISGASYWGFKAGVPESNTNNISGINTVTHSVTLTAPYVGMVVGDTVKIDDTKPLRPYSGSYQVDSIVGAVLHLTGGHIAKWGTPPYLGHGKLNKVNKTIVPITDVIIRCFTHRNRGRPFDSPRGRRKGLVALA